jgi:hypothetical protein
MLVHVMTSTPSVSYIRLSCPTSERISYVYGLIVCTVSYGNNCLTDLSLDFAHPSIS